MVQEIRCIADGIDLCAAGVVDLPAVTVTLRGDGEVLSEASFPLATGSGGGGYEFRSKQHFTLGLFDTAAVLWVRRYFGGYAGQPEVQVEGDEPVWSIPAQGYDLQLDTLLYKATDGSGTFLITSIAAARFYEQVLAAVTLVAPPGAVTPLDLSEVPTGGIWTTNLDEYVVEKPMTLRELFQALCNNLQAAVPAVRPRFSIQPSSAATSGWGDPAVRLWDAADTTVTVLTVSDAPGGGEVAAVEVKTRKLDGSQQGTGAVAIGADGIMGVATADAGVIAQYPNPCDPDQIWWLKPIQNNEWVTQADVDAAAAQHLAAHLYDRESIIVGTYTYCRPGDFVRFKDTVWGLDLVYPIAEVQIAFRTPDTPYYQLTLGNRLLRYGDTENGALAPVVFRDLIAPDPPTALAIIENIYEGQTRTVRVHVEWTASQARDTRYYIVETQVAGEPTARWSGPVYGTDYNILFLPPATGLTVRVKAVDYNGNWSGPSNTVTATTAPRDNPAPPTSIVFGTPRWDQAGAVQPITFTLPVPSQWGTHVKVYETATPTNVVQDLVINGSDTTHTIYMLTRGTGYTVRLTSRTQWGDEGTTATTSTFTAPFEAPAAVTSLAVTTGVGSGPITTTGYIKASWTASTFDPIGYYEWVITATGGGRQYRRSGTFPADATDAVISDLPLNRPLTLSITTVSGWGPYPGPYATASFTIGPPPLPAPPDFASTDPTATTPDSVAPAGWDDLTSANGATSGRSTATVYVGKASLTQSIANTSGSTITNHSDPIHCQEGMTYEWWLAVKGTSTNGVWAAAVAFYNSSDTLVGVPTPLDGDAPPTTWTEVKGAFPVPTGAVYYRIRLTYSFLTAGSGTVYYAIAPDRWRPRVQTHSLDDLAVTSGKIGANAVIAGKLADGAVDTTARMANGIISDAKFTTAVKTNPSWAAWDVSANPLSFYDGAGAVGRISYDDTGVGTLQIQALNAADILLQPGGGTGALLRVGGTGAITATGAHTWVRATKQAAAFTPDATASIWPCEGIFTVSLPDAATCTGRRYTFPVTGAASVVTLDGDGSQPIGGRGTWRLERDSSLTIQSTGGGWDVLEGHNHNAGTAFPTSGLYDGLEYVRRDLYQHGYYHAASSSWLSDEVQLNFVLRTPDLMPFGGDDWVYVGATRGDYGYRVMRWECETYVAGTNDGSNYWTVKLQVNTSGVGNSDMASFTTSSDAAFDWTRHAETSFSGNPTNPSNQPIIEHRLEKTSSAGDLYLAITLWVRKVLT